ncbi:unnamed protein product [Pichia kudriavzevii]
MTNGPLPTRVHDLLSHSQFLHLATCSDNIPHVSLMNYTFIENDPSSSNCELLKSAQHMILIATPQNTKKYNNLMKNNKVSLLVHDWVTPNQGGADSVLRLLQSINQSEVGELSVTLGGHVFQNLIDPSTEEYKFFKNLHLQKNPEARAFIEGDSTAFVLIQIDESKVSDSNNNVENFK